MDIDVADKLAEADATLAQLKVRGWLPCCHGDGAVHAARCCLLQLTLLGSTCAALCSLQAPAVGPSSPAALPALPQAAISATPALASMGDSLDNVEQLLTAVKASIDALVAELSYDAFHPVRLGVEWGAGLGPSCGCGRAGRNLVLHSWLHTQSQYAHPLQSANRAPAATPAPPPAAYPTHTALPPRPRRCMLRSRATCAAPC